jgi:trehalose/maltose transport system permease protein
MRALPKLVAIDGPWRNPVLRWVVASAAFSLGFVLVFFGLLPPILGAINGARWDSNLLSV